jgi:hypothetical protein
MKDEGGRMNEIQLSFNFILHPSAFILPTTHSLPLAVLFAKILLPRARAGAYTLRRPPPPVAAPISGSQSLNLPATFFLATLYGHGPAERAALAEFER